MGQGERGRQREKRRENEKANETRTDRIDNRFRRLLQQHGGGDGEAEGREG